MGIWEKSIYYLRTLKEYILIKRSGFFDSYYYYKNYPDVRKMDIDPLFHFIRHGWKEGRNPSNIFNTKFYLSQNKDVRIKDVNPLIHYILFGNFESRHPNLYASITHYLDSSLDENHPPILSNFFTTLFKNDNLKKCDLYDNLESMASNEKKTSFSLPDKNIINKYKPELINWNGEEVKLVQRNGKLWIIKGPLTRPNFRRELLVYSLARRLVNAAEIKTLKYDEIYELMDFGLIDIDASPINTFLVRLAQHYTIEELPLRSLDSAMAGELVFSLLVRRRDPSHFNRAYIESEIPVFYDYHASLNYEPWLFDLDSFFEHIGLGHPGRWRVIERKDLPLTTLSSRKMIDGSIFVNDKKIFNESLDIIASKIRSRKMNIGSLIKQAGYCGDDINILSNFLQKSKNELLEDIDKMKKVIFSPILTY